MKIDIQRLRNLTTGRLHTDIGCVYQDLELITGESGLMTHMLPRAALAVEPWLREHVKDLKFWEDAYDVTHVGEFELPEPTDDDRKAMTERYLPATKSACRQPNPLAGKTVNVAQV